LNGLETVSISAWWD